ncbi:MAG: hypothetical protein K0S12_857 [Bacteroidetes bacterium]|nr:hypothetical protein [Bacteroidota bacterium]
MFKAITPKFINRLDAHLLVHHPVVWMSKIHYVAWHGLLLWLFSAFLGLVLPIHLKRDLQYELWYFLFTVIGVLLLCFWVYHHAIFNREKNYGSRSFLDEFKNFILVFISVAVFLLVPCPFEIIYNQRVADSYGDEEIIRDINTLNELDPYMVNSRTGYFSWYDSTSKMEYFTVKKLAAQASAPYTPYFLQGDSLKFPQLLTSYQRYKQYRPVNNYDEVKAKVQEFERLASKYDCFVPQSADVLAKKYLDLLSKERVPASDYDYYVEYQYELSRIFINVCGAKFNTLFIFKHDYLWTIFYFVMSITAFLLLFKMTYWRQFLVLIVVLLVYPLVMFIFSQLMPYSGFIRGAGFFITSLLALIGFSFVTLFITGRNHRYYQPYFTVFNQLVYVTLIFTPLLVVGFLHECTEVFHNSLYAQELAGWSVTLPPGTQYPQVTPEGFSYEAEYLRQLESLYYFYWEAEYQRWLTIAKYTGIALFVIALPFFKELFVKQISLPKKS